MLVPPASAAAPTVAPAPAHHVAEAGAPTMLWIIGAGLTLLSLMALAFALMPQLWASAERGDGDAAHEQVGPIDRVLS